jgi:hypothetical protein
MRLFGKPSPAEEHQKQAEQLLKQGDARDALGALKMGFVADVKHRPLYAVAAKALAALGGVDEAKLFLAAHDKMESAVPFFNLGYHFVEVGQDDFAVPFLERAHALAPTERVVANELALALAGSFRPAKGRDVLARVDYTQEWGIAYQYHWCRLLAGDDPKDAEAFVAAPPKNAEPGQEDNIAYMRLRLSECLERRRSIPQPLLEIRDWHFIQYGAAILDFMDERYADGGKQVAGGRHVYQAASDEALAEILGKLKALLEGLGRQFERVVALPDRDSEIVGCAVAAWLGLPWERADEANLEAPRCLVVAGEASRFGEFPQVHTVQDGQTTFALWQQWTQPGPWTPDIVGVLAQVYVLPWSGNRLRIDPETNKPVQLPEDSRPVKEIVAELQATAPSEDPSFAETLAFYLARKALVRGGKAGQGRHPFQRDSPVPGSYFS